MRFKNFPRDHAPIYPGIDNTRPPSQAPLTAVVIVSLQGTSRVNEALHAVVENKLGETALSETNNSVLERNRALLQYVSTLANSNHKNDAFNYEFVQSLLDGGADMNVSDQHGQTMFHEVARSWNTDVAKFLLQRGMQLISIQYVCSHAYHNSHTELNVRMNIKLTSPKICHY